MHVLELQRNPEANEDFREEDGVRKRMSALLKEQGLLVRSGASIPIAPPLVINREQVDELGRHVGTRRSVAWSATSTSPDPRAGRADEPRNGAGARISAGRP